MKGIIGKHSHSSVTRSKRDDKVLYLPTVEAIQKARRDVIYHLGLLKHDPYLTPGETG